MAHHSMNKEKIFIELDASELTPAHVRMVKTLNILLQQVLVTGDEGQYFEGSAEIMRQCASLIKQARFIDDEKLSDIAYAEQVLEFSMDTLQEHIAGTKVINYDN
jgi:hypothetical protein